MKDNKDVATWKIVLFLSGVAFFCIYGVISCYLDVYRLLFK